MTLKNKRLLGLAKSFLSLGLVLGLQNSALAGEADARRMKSEIDAIATIFESAYAPKEWKKRFANWSAQEAGQFAKSQITSETTTIEFRKILREFFLSTQDYHVGVRFYSTEAASLPFLVQPAEGRFFVVYADEKKVPKGPGAPAIGDEVLEFDGQPVKDLVAELQAQTGGNVQETDLALASLYLTNRRGASVLDVPRGSASIKFKKKKSEKTFVLDIAWDYTPESLPPYQVTEDVMTDPQPIYLTGLNTVLKSQGFGLSEKHFSSPLAINLMSELPAENPFQIGGRRGFLPHLGEPIWMSEKEDEFYSYIYQDESGKNIGVLRIPSYVPTAGYQKAVDSFARILTHFQKHTAGLVIEQMNNPGGSVFYLYALASMLSDQALYAPRHQLAITPGEVEGALQAIEMFESKSKEEILKELTGQLSGYEVDMNFLKLYEQFSRFMVEQWALGQTLTPYTHLWGVDRINPHSKVNYTKPILILTNELDFSGGDFFPTILQDNKRAVIMGTRTAGAGGYVNQTQMTSLYGLKLFSFTGSLAARIDGEPIENLGVTPDVLAPMTAMDRMNNYSDFRSKVKKQINEMVK